MLKQFLAFINSNTLFTTKSQLLVAVSGGLDSVVLTHLLQQAGYDFAMAHCNFKLRGTESDEDETFVRNLADSMSKACYVRAFDTKKHASDLGISTQMAARELRYKWFNSLKEEHGFDYLLTAHHQNDVLETAIFNFIKGTGAAGLRGIKLKNDATLRPLLCFTRNELEQYAQDNKLSWREDSSNATTDYHRNFIRKKIVPLMEEVNPNLISTYFNTRRRMLAIEELLQAEVMQLKKAIKIKGYDHYLKANIVEKANLAVLEAFLNDYGFNLDQAQTVVDLVKGKMVGKIILSATHQLNIDRDQILISPIATNLEHCLLPKQGIAKMGEVILESKLEENWSMNKSPKVALLDADQLEFPLTVRPWQDGDNFHPLGMKGKKKLSDFMIDEKIPLNLKRRVLVLLSQNKVVWVVGHRIDDRFKITQKTKLAAIISLKP